MRAIRKVLTISLAIMLTVVSSGVVAFAGSQREVPDLPDGPYQLTVKMQSSSQDGTTTGIKNAEISIYKAADLKVKDGIASYTAEKNFDCGISFDGMNASQSKAAAKKFAKLAKNVAGTAGTCDSDGNVTFKNLEAGIYLVVLDSYSKEDSGYKAMEPFLVKVPDIDAQDKNSGWITKVTAVPKVAIVRRGYVKADPPVKKIVKGNPKTPGTFEFEMKACDIQNPMPVGSTNGAKRATIVGAGSFEFGTITFTEAGTYKYELREINRGEKGYKYDSTEYTLTFKVTSEGNDLVLDSVYKDDKGNVVDVPQFTNVFTPKETPNTGDTARLLLMLGLMIFSLAGMLYIGRTRRKADKAEEQ